MGTIRGTLGFVLVLSFASASFAHAQEASDPSVDAVLRARSIAELAAARTRRGEQHPELVRLRHELERRPEPVLSAEQRPAVCEALARGEADLRVEVTRLATRYGEAHPTMRAGRARIAAFASERARVCGEI